MPTLRRRSPVTDAQIIEHYNETHSAKQTATSLGVSGSLVETVLTKYKVPRPGVQAWRDSRKLYRGCEAEMRADYETGATYEQLIAKYGTGSTWSVIQALKRAGTVMRDNPAREEDDAEVERVRELRGLGMAQKAIANELGRSQTFIGRLMKRHDIPTKRNDGENHPDWKGGRYVDPNGYVSVSIEFDDPMASMRRNDGYVYEHRLVMARKLGRPLRRSETVHHIDGCHDNNAPANLQLRQGRHGKNTAWVCLACGSHNVEAMPLADDPTASDASAPLFE